MTGARVRIDEIVIELADEARVRDADQTIRTALAILGSRLAGAPWGMGAQAPARGLELLRLEPIPASWLASPQAAARIADGLDEQILRQWREAGR